MEVQGTSGRSVLEKCFVFGSACIGTEQVLEDRGSWKMVKTYTPVELAYQESFRFHDPWNGRKLYAANGYDSQHYQKRLRHLARERKTQLNHLNKDIEGLKRKYFNYGLEKVSLKYLEPPHGKKNPEPINPDYNL